MQESLKIFLFVAGISLAAYWILAWGEVYWKERVHRWAATRGYSLIEYRSAAFFEGPARFLRSENQTAFRVKVRDSSGKMLAGWLIFGHNWNPFSAPDELIEERWDQI
jgi:hypothetical protein